MSKLILLFICCNLLNLNVGEYIAPKSVEYPFGDEVFNSDISEDRVQEEVREINIEIIKDIYTFCPNITDDEEERMNREIPYNDNLCEKCDVRPTVDKIGVLLECFNCTDVSELMTLSQEETPPSHLLFLTTYLEIVNYTAPEINEFVTMNAVQQ